MSSKIGILETVNDKEYGDVDLFYSNYYEQVLRTGLIGAAQDRTHRAMEKQWKSEDRFETVLEVGSGKGEHFGFVRHSFAKYYETDLRTNNETENSTFGLRSVDGGKGLIRENADVMQLHYADHEFDRLIATCLVLHLEKPEKALSEMRRVTKSGGVISILVPCEPGLLLRISRRMLTSRKARQAGFSGYDLFNARDHINYLSGIDKLIKHVFRSDKIVVSRKPFKLPSWNLNLYFVYTIHRGSGD